MSQTMRYFKLTRMAKSTARYFHQSINEQRYDWLKNLCSPLAAQFIASARNSIVKDGIATFPDFITSEALQDSIGEVQMLSSRAHILDDDHNIYYKTEDRTFPSNHVRNLNVNTKVGIISHDQLDQQRALLRVYESDLLKNLLEKVFDRPLYRSCDPLGRVSVNVLREGWSDQWHFDESEFTTTLMIQQPDAGGYFEATQALRTSREEFEFEKVEQAINNGLTVSKFRVSPGTLTVFSGSRCLHRVTEVEGCKERQVAVFTFASEPGFLNTEKTQQFFFGRVNSQPHVSQ